MLEYIKVFFAQPDLCSQFITGDLGKVLNRFMCSHQEIVFLAKVVKKLLNQQNFIYKCIGQ